MKKMMTLLVVISLVLTGCQDSYDMGAYKAGKIKTKILKYNSIEYVESGGCYVSSEGTMTVSGLTANTIREDVNITISTEEDTFQIPLDDIICLFELRCGARTKKAVVSSYVYSIYEVGDWYDPNGDYSY